MKLTLASTRPGMARTGGSVYVEVAIDPGAPPTGSEASPRPVALCLVFDRSGSMADQAGNADRGRPPYLSYTPCPPPPEYGFARTKMDFVKVAAHAVADRLRDGDFVGLVSFSNSARVEAPMTQVNSWTRAMLHRAIDAFRPEASTNLHEGLVVGEQQFTPALVQSHNCKLILLSDGLANVGVTSPGGMADFALSAHRRGVTVSALGVGYDYEAELMGTLAQCGGGRFHHIGDLFRLPEIVIEEFRSAAAVLARQVTVEITAGPLVGVGPNLNFFPQRPGPDGVSLVVGDLVGPRSIVLELATQAEVGGQSVPVRAACRWEDDRRQLHEEVGTLDLPVLPAAEVEALPLDIRLVEEVGRLLEARIVRQASGAYDAGDLARTQASVQAGLNDLYSMAHASPAAAPVLREAAGRVSELGARFARREVAQAEAKEMYGTAFDITSGSGTGPAGHATRPGAGGGQPAGSAPGGGRNKSPEK